MSKFLWHTLSADHEIDRLISDVIRHTVNTGNKKRDFNHAYSRRKLDGN